MRSFKNYIGVSKRDISAGFVLGGSALLVAIMFNLWNFAQTFIALGFDSASIAEYRRLGNDIFLLAIIVAPVIAVFVATAVWRLMLPDEPAPDLGAIAGGVSAFGSLFGFAVIISFVGTLSRFPHATFGSPVSDFIFITVIITIFGGIVTLPIVAPVGGIVGYGYERYLVSAGNQSSK